MNKEPVAGKAVLASLCGFSTNTASQSVKGLFGMDVKSRLKRFHKHCYSHDDDTLIIRYCHNHQCAYSTQFISINKNIRLSLASFMVDKNLKKKEERMWMKGLPEAHQKGEEQEVYLMNTIHLICEPNVDTVMFHQPAMSIKNQLKI